MGEREDLMKALGLTEDDAATSSATREDLMAHLGLKDEEDVSVAPSDSGTLSPAVIAIKEHLRERFADAPGKFLLPFRDKRVSPPVKTGGALEYRFQRPQKPTAPIQAPPQGLDPAKGDFIASPASGAPITPPDLGGQAAASIKRALYGEAPSPGQPFRGESGTEMRAPRGAEASFPESPKRPPADLSDEPTMDNLRPAVNPGGGYISSNPASKPLSRFFEEKVAPALPEALHRAGAFSKASAAVPAPVLDFIHDYLATEGLQFSQKAVEAFAKLPLPDDMATETTKTVGDLTAHIFQPIFPSIGVAAAEAEGERLADAGAQFGPIGGAVGEIYGQAVKMGGRISPFDVAATAAGPLAKAAKAAPLMARSTSPLAQSAQAAMQASEAVGAAAAKKVSSRAARRVAIAGLKAADPTLFDHLAGYLRGLSSLSNNRGAVTPGQVVDSFLPPSHLSEVKLREMEPKLMRAAVENLKGNGVIDDQAVKALEAQAVHSLRESGESKYAPLAYQFFLNPAKKLEKLGGEGAAVVAMARDLTHGVEQASGAIIHNVKSALSGLSKGDRMVVGAMQDPIRRDKAIAGLRKMPAKRAQKIARAYREMNEAIDPLLKEMNSMDVFHEGDADSLTPIFDRDNFFAYYYDEGSKSFAESKARAAKHEMKERLGDIHPKHPEFGKSGSLGAADVEGALAAARDGRMGFPEATRSLPGRGFKSYIKDPEEVMRRMVSDLTYRMARTKIYGKKDATIRALLDQVKANYPGEVGLVNQVQRTLLEGSIPSMSGEAFDKLSGFNVVTHLGSAGLRNRTQYWANAPAEASWKAVWDAHKQAQQAIGRDKFKDLIESVVLESYRRDFSELFGIPESDLAGKKLFSFKMSPGQFLEWTRHGGAERNNRTRALLLGAKRAEQLADELKATNRGSSDWLRIARSLKDDFAVDMNEIARAATTGRLSETTRLRAGQELSRRINFHSKLPIDHPFIFNDPIGRWLTQFAKFKYYQGQYFMSKVRRGDLQALSSLIAASAAAGLGVRTTLDILGNKPTEDWFAVQTGENIVDTAKSAKKGLRPGLTPKQRKGYAIDTAKGAAQAAVDVLRASAEAGGIGMFDEMALELYPELTGRKVNRSSERGQIFIGPGPQEMIAIPQEMAQASTELAEGKFGQGGKSLVRRAAGMAPPIMLGPIPVPIGKIANRQFNPPATKGGGQARSLIDQIREAIGRKTRGER